MYIHTVYMNFSMYIYNVLPIAIAHLKQTQHQAGKSSFVILSNAKEETPQSL